MYQDPTQGSGAQPGMNGQPSVWNQHGFSQSAGGYASLMGQQDYGAQQGPYTPMGQQPPMPSQSVYPPFGQVGAAPVQGGYGGYAQPAAYPQGNPQPAPQQGAYNQQIQGYGTPQAVPDMQNRYTQQPANDGAWPTAQAADYRQQPDPRQAWPGQDVYNGPPEVPTQPFNWDLVLLIVACGVIPVLFLTAMITRNIIVTIIAAASAVGAAVWLWQRPVFQRPTQMMITVLYGVATLVAVILAVTVPKGAAPDQTVPGTGSPGGPGSSAVVTPEASSDPNNSGGAAIETPGAGITGPLASDPTVQVADKFMTYWTQNDKIRMMDFCSPTWANKQTGTKNPRNQLMMALKNNIPVTFTATNVTGTENDLTRTVTYETTVKKYDNTVVPCTISVILVQEYGTWYVDPDSLNFAATTPTPQPTIVPVTPTPVPAGYVDPATKLYYNPDGGSYYHIDPNCSTVGSKYKPLKGVFTYAERGTGKHSKLKPCEACGAPK